MSLCIHSQPFAISTNQDKYCWCTSYNEAVCLFGWLAARLALALDMRAHTHIHQCTKEGPPEYHNEMFIFNFPLDFLRNDDDGDGDGIYHKVRIGAQYKLAREPAHALAHIQASKQSVSRSCVYRV